MSNNISNFTVKAEYIKDSVQNQDEAICMDNTNQENEIRDLSVESIQTKNEDYSKINIVSFKKSFFKLQRNYNFVD